jgi:hypothetical protein
MKLAYDQLMVNNGVDLGITYGQFAQRPVASQRVVD